MNQPHSNETWIDIAPGVRRRTIAAGDKIHQIIVRLDAASRVPEHRHVQEQVAFCVSGRLYLTLDGVRHTVEPGSSLLIPGNVPHSADVEVDTIVIDTFSPPRDDMLAQDAAAQKK